MPKELPIRIILVHPPQDVRFCVQRGKAELLPPAQTGAELLTFDLAVRVGMPQANGTPNLLGPFAQGTPADRFIYVNAGTAAGQLNSTWTRRAKIKLAGITAAMIEETLATPGAVLVARIASKAKDGGPAAASVPLLGDGWQVVK